MDRYINMFYVRFIHKDESIQMLRYMKAISVTKLRKLTFCLTNVTFICYNDNKNTSITVHEALFTNYMSLEYTPSWLCATQPESVVRPNYKNGILLLVEIEMLYSFI